MHANDNGASKTSRTLLRAGYILRRLRGSVVARITMRIDVVHLPSELREHHLRERSVVVFDVLRATTSMIAALKAGAREVRIFSTLEDVRSAASVRLPMSRKSSL